MTLKSCFTMGGCVTGGRAGRSIIAGLVGSMPGSLCVNVWMQGKL